MTFTYVLIYAILGSVGAVSAAALLLLPKESWIVRIGGIFCPVRVSPFRALCSVLVSRQFHIHCVS